MPAPEAPAPLAAGLDGARFSEAERRTRVRLWQTLCDHFFARYVPAGATVLDLGAGYCDLTNHVRAARRIAIDLNPETLRAAAEGVEVHSLALSALGSVVAPGSVDVAFASNVFEHSRSPDALLEVLAAIRTETRSGGRLLVLQPYIRIVGGRFWDFFDHTLPLTENGMRVVECRARLLPYTTKSRIPHHSALIRLYLAFPPAQWLLGKQMLVVGERDA